MFTSIITMTNDKLLEYIEESHDTPSLVLQVVSYDNANIYYDNKLKFIDVDYDKTKIFLVCSRLFDNIDDPNYAKAMRKDQANNFARFINLLEDKIDTVIISCDTTTGIAPGIAGAIAKHYFNDDWEYLNEENAPNMHCYNLMLNELNKLREQNEKLIRKES